MISQLLREQIDEEKNKMSKYDSLWVRACKSANSGQRLRSVYRRVYLRNASEATYQRAAISILSGIVDKLSIPYRTEDLLNLIDPNRYAFVGTDQRTHEERVLNALTSIIGLTKITDLPGYRAPLKFRNK